MYYEVISLFYLHVFLKRNEPIFSLNVHMFTDLCLIILLSTSNQSRLVIGVTQTPVDMAYVVCPSLDLISVHHIWSSTDSYSLF